jgi:hypothetical protein
VPNDAIGSYWMGQGVTIALRGDFNGVGLILEAE